MGHNNCERLKFVVGYKSNLSRVAGPRMRGRGGPAKRDPAAPHCGAIAGPNMNP
jgi:hypothetical protein